MHVSVRFAVVLAATLAAAAAHAQDLNGFRRAHHRPPLVASAALAGAAYAHAHDLAQRRHLDHRGFRERMAVLASTAAENVLVGCADEACAIRVWARSPRHRANMLLRGVTSYGLASATAGNGRRYWVLELGN